MRITEKQLDALCEHLNTTLKRPLKPWVRDDQGNLKAQIGNIHVYMCLGVCALHEMANEGGGVRVIVSGRTKRDCFDQVHAYLRGVESCQR